MEIFADPINRLYRYSQLGGKKGADEILKNRTAKAKRLAVTYRQNMSLLELMLYV